MADLNNSETAQAGGNQVIRAVEPNSVVLGNCLDLELPDVDIVITDPPYPNNAGHFDEGIAAAIKFIETYKCDHWIIFWDEMTVPPCPLPLVARHIWHRSNSNRPDNYEAIYEFHADGKKRASRVFSYGVIYPGMTGLEWEATGHPTQKNLKLMKKIITLTTKEGDTVLDPFAGSGATLLAAKELNRNYIGAEIDKKYYADIKRRLRQEMLF